MNCMGAWGFLVGDVGVWVVWVVYAYGYMGSLGGMECVGRWCRWFGWVCMGSWVGVGCGLWVCMG